MRINNNIIIASPQVLSANYIGPAIYLGHATQYAIQCFFSGSAVGTFSLQCSNDAGNITGASLSSQVTNVTNWTDLTSSDISISGSGDITWADENVAYVWVRVKYVHTSGSGTIDKLTANSKGF